MRAEINIPILSRTPKYMPVKPHHMARYYAHRIKESISFKLICAIFLTLLFLLGLIAFILWLSLRPYRPRFHVHDFSIPGLAQRGGPENAQVIYNATARNANKKTGIYYDSIQLTVYYGDQSIGGSKLLFLFYQKPKTTTVMAGKLSGANLTVSIQRWNQFKADLRRGEVFFRFEISSTIRYRRWTYWDRKRHKVHANCPVGVGPDGLILPRYINGNKNTTRTVIIVVVSVAAGMILLAVLACILIRNRIKRKPQAKHENIVAEFEDVDELLAAESHKYTLSTIKNATNDFSNDNELGQGGFGAVYKGILSNGQEIAVKKLSKYSDQGDLEFKNEVLLLAKLQHRNIVRLLGFCLEGVEKLLVYEFVQNSSLDHFIFDPIKRSCLDWEKRNKIIRGIARGILYLHEDSQIMIIHRDLKPNNILLDGAMNPKIADFGFARLFGHDETERNTMNIAGTYGYMAPEYAMHGQFSVKSDVFSFGVLVLEIISGQHNDCFRFRGIVTDLLSFAWKNWCERTVANMVDPCLMSGSGSISEILRCIHIALLCVQEKAANRPIMASVILMLNSFSLTLAPPSEPACYIPTDFYGSDTSVEHKYSRESYRNSTKSSIQVQSDNSSGNHASITDLYS